MTAPVRSARTGSVLTLTLDRPERRNALDLPSLLAVRQALEEAWLDEATRAVVLTGAGPAFCAGGDIAAMDAAARAGTLPAFFRDLTGEQELAVRALLGMPKPVVAALPGVAAGGGLSLALACDWRIAAESATFVPAFPSLGAVPDGGLTYLLPHFLGIGLAQELLFARTTISAGRAKELGLVHEVVPDDRLAARAADRAAELADGPTFAYGWMKRLLVAAYSSSLERQLALEREGAVAATRRSELPEGIRAFREKRPPKFAP